MEVQVLKHPTAEDWILARKCTLATISKDSDTEPSEEWKVQLLKARHSPIRTLQFCFKLIDIPYWVSVHLVRHVHATPFVSTQRNDRQKKYDRGKAPQDQPVTMCWYMNAEELMTIASKRLCAMASAETQAVVWQMCQQVICMCPEFEGMLKAACDWQNGKCYEMNGGCGKHDW